MQTSSQSRSGGSSELTWLAPLAGGLAPGAVLWLRHAGHDGPIAAFGSFSVWAMRDLVIAYALALPALAIARRLGVRRTLALWAIAATVGAPMGYALANPLDFAWTPSEQDFEHGAYWGEMISYMALFGLTGAAYALALRTSAGIK